MRVWTRISHKPGVLVLSDSKQQLWDETLSAKKRCKGICARLGQDGGCEGWERAVSMYAW